jgi:hypothetical protein
VHETPVSQMARERRKRSIGHRKRLGATGFVAAMLLDGALLASGQNVDCSSGARKYARLLLKLGVVTDGAGRRTCYHNTLHLSSSPSIVPLSSGHPAEDLS